MGRVWNGIKAVNNAVDKAAEVLANTGSSGQFRSDGDGKCQERGRAAGNNRCGRDLKRGQPTCGHRICTNAYAAHIVANPAGHLPAGKKQPLINHATGHLKHPHHPGSNGTVMRQQIKVKGKWVWSDEVQDGE